MFDEQRGRGSATLVIRPQGRLDAATADVFRAELRDAVAAGSSRLVLDMSEVSFIDSRGLGAIVRGLKMAREAGGDLRLASPTAHVKSVLRLTSLSRILPVYSSVEDALADLNP